MNVYFISGLGADRRVFNHIKLPEGFNICHLDWIVPEKEECLEDYALRLAGKINKEEKFVLLGLSMGGMVASEISKKLKPECTILISSVWTHKLFPITYKWADALGIYRIIPPSFFKSVSLIKRIFSNESAEDKILLNQLIRDSNPAFIKWAIRAILRWKNEVKPENLWHIHGSSDKLLPVKSTVPTHLINNGGHMMLVSRATEINEIIGSILCNGRQCRNFQDDY